MSRLLNVISLMMKAKMMSENRVWRLVGSQQLWAAAIVGFVSLGANDCGTAALAAEHDVFGIGYTSDPQWTKQHGRSVLPWLLGTDLPTCTGAVSVNEAIRLGVENRWHAGRLDKWCLHRHTWLSGPHPAEGLLLTELESVEHSQPAKLLALSELVDCRALALAIRLAYWRAAWYEAKLKLALDYRSDIQSMIEKACDPEICRRDHLEQTAQLARVQEEVSAALDGYNAALDRLKAQMQVAPTSLISLQEELVVREPIQELSFFLLQAGRLRTEIARCQKQVAEADDQFASMLARAEQGVRNAVETTVTITSVDALPESAATGGNIVDDAVADVHLDESDQLVLANFYLQQAKLGKKGTDLKVAQDVVTAWIDLDSARREIQITQDCCALMDKERAESERDYESGKIAFQDQMLVDAQVVEAHKALLKALCRYRMAEAQLIHASGSCYGKQIEVCPWMATDDSAR